MKLQTQLMDLWGGVAVTKSRSKVDSAIMALLLLSFSHSANWTSQ